MMEITLIGLEVHCVSEGHTFVNRMRPWRGKRQSTSSVTQGTWERAAGVWHVEGCHLGALTFSSWGFFILFIASADKPSRILWYYPWSLHVAYKCGTVLSQNRTENKWIFRNLVWEYCVFVYGSVFKNELGSNLCMFSFAWENDLQQQASVFWISHCL